MPIQEIEAWLLLDEHLLRSVAGFPAGKAPLNLPKPKHIENKARPKEMLSSALVAAQKPGRPSQQFGYSRRLLLERLDIDGPITKLSAWQKLIADVDRAIAELRS